jgi:hypothetical protein
MKKTLSKIANGRSFYDITEDEAKQLNHHFYMAWVQEHLYALWDQLVDEDKSEFAPAIFKEFGVEPHILPKNFWTKEESLKRIANAKSPDKITSSRPVFKHNIRKYATAKSRLTKIIRSNKVASAIAFLFEPKRWGMLYRNQVGRYRFRKFIREHRDCFHPERT